MTTEATNVSPAETPVPSAEAVGNLTVREQREKKDAGIPSGQLWIQPKLTVGAPDDPYEKEADAVAEKVMQMSESNFVQQKCGGCEEEANFQFGLYDASLPKPQDISSKSFLQQKSEAPTTETLPDKSRGNNRSKSLLDND